MRSITANSLWGGVFFALLSPTLFAAPDSLEDISLEDLTKTEITSVSRRSQNLAHVPAAAFVITSEDIRRSGAYALPDVLRMVPGIEVAQVDAGRYAVTARGFNGRFANKLQVLVDGRSIYSPIFSGVMWEHDPVALDDIERIEVIRGPGAAMWGANAVSGVINIITKHSAAEIGGLVAPTLGTNGFGQIYGRYGQRVDDRTSWKLSIQGRRSDPSTLYVSGHEGNDSLKNGQVNFRFDRNLGGGSDFTFWAGATKLKLGDLALLDPEPLPAPHLVYAPLEQIDDGQMIGGRYRWLMGAVESTLQLSATFEHIGITDWFDSDRKTYDLDYQGRYATGPHDLLWGLSHRSSTDDAHSDSVVLAFNPQRFTMRSTGVFIHDDWALIPQRLKLGLGARWENSTLGDSTFSPSATLMWTPSLDHSLWAKLARAPRVPSRGESHVSVVTAMIPPNILIRSVPMPKSLKPETMDSLELGYRVQFAPSASVNVTAYRQRYRKRLSGEDAGISLALWPYIVQNVAICNCSAGWIDGVEIAADWLVSPAWRLQLSLTATRVNLDTAATPQAAADNATQEKRTPKHHGSLRSQWNLGANQQFDAWLRGSAGYDLVNAPYPNLIRVPGYLTLDLRYAYRVNRDLELSVTGRNLAGPRRYEYVADYVPSALTEISPSVMLGLRLGF